MRRLVNDGYEAVEEMLAGYVAAQREIRRFCRK